MGTNNAPVEGLFVRTKRKPYVWTCRIQRKGILYAGAFHKLWGELEDAFGSHRVKIIQTTECRLTQKEYDTLKNGDTENE